MKKITMTKTTTVTGFDEADTLETFDPTEGTTTDYVSDVYTYHDHWQDHHMPDSLVEHDSDAVNYTLTLRNIFSLVEGMASELEDACNTLEVHSTLIEDDRTLCEDDRERLSSALEDASSSLSALSRECMDVSGTIDNALDAFKRLPMDD